MGCSTSKAGENAAGTLAPVAPVAPVTAGEALKRNAQADNDSSYNADSAGRRLSLKSEGAMQALAECQQQLDAYSASVISIEASLDDEALGKTSEATEADASGTLLQAAQRQQNPACHRYAPASHN